MRQFVKRNYVLIEWVLGGIAIILPVIAWLSVQHRELTLYDIFPPLGLIAFGLMWTHFVMGALKRYADVETREPGLYMPISMGLVLALIILHPGLLWFALFLDGYGLPPESYLKAYSSQVLLVLLGSASLIIFLAYEFKRVFGQKSWWKYIDWLQIVGMAAIFIHALGLGRDLQMNWFMVVWWLYGITLAASIIYSRVIWRK